MVYSYVGNQNTPPTPKDKKNKIKVNYKYIMKRQFLTLMANYSIKFNNAALNH